MNLPRPETNCVCCKQAWSYDTRYSAEFDIKICENCGFSLSDGKLKVYILQKLFWLLEKYK